MRRREIRKLHAKAEEAYKDGALAALSKHARYRAYYDRAFQRRALDLAYNQGYEAGEEAAPELPVSVWSLVLAEAMRP